MSYLGDFRLGDTLDLKFTTAAASTGAPTTLAGTPVVSAYPGNSTTQITAGITLTVDFDSVTGLHNVRVVASSGNGYATATNYSLVITTGTVGGTSAVGYVIGSFSIEARSAVMPTVAARTLDVSSTGEAGLDWANIGSPTTAQSLTGTSVPGTFNALISGYSAVSGSFGEVFANMETSADIAAAMFTVSTGETFATAASGSPVSEIANNSQIDGIVNADIRYVNGIEVTGTGVEGSDEWRPT